MSRIGKAPITIASGITVDVAKNNVVTVKGPKGELTQKIHAEMIVEVNDGEVVVKRPTEQKRHKAMHGLYRALINNMVIGVTDGYKIELELVGVGYRATTQGQVLEMQLGFSHPIMMMMPPEIKINAETEKGKNPIVTLESIDKQLVGQMAAKIKSIRKSEPYKGKGIKFKGEQLRRKAGKTAAA